MGTDYVKALMWPVIFWVVVDVYFFLISLVKLGGTSLTDPEWDVMGAVFGGTNALLVVIALVGIWAGRAVILNGGQWFDPILAGLAVGLVCGGLGYLLFAFAHPEETLTSNLVMPGSIMDFSLSLGGALLGGWWTMSENMAMGKRA